MEEEARWTTMIQPVDASQERERERERESRRGGCISIHNNLLLPWPRVRRGKKKNEDGKKIIPAKREGSDRWDKERRKRGKVSLESRDKGWVVNGEKRGGARVRSSRNQNIITRRQAITRRQNHGEIDGSH